MAANKADLESYLAEGIHRINGWCIPHLWQAIWPLAQSIGPGPVAEIGVFEGKFFVGLCKTFSIGPDAGALAIDVFDLQQFNLDGAGVGKLEVFRANLDRHGIGRDNVECLRADSLALRRRDVEAILSRHGLFRAFSVDGCHDVLHTVHDIELAMEMTDPAGLIFVDDYLNANWPGVLEAVSRLYLLSNPLWVPLAVTCNKLILCSIPFHTAYLKQLSSHLKEHWPQTRSKACPRFGHQTLTILPDMGSQMTRLPDAA